MHPLLRHSGAFVSAALGLPLLGLAALLRPEWREGFGQRLGVGGPWKPGAVWVHAASVGEAFAAARLFPPLEMRGFPVCASATTPAGRELLESAHAERAPRFAPLDHPWCAAAALERAVPRALVLVETELWPCWIAAAARRKIPVVVISARLSDRSLPRYQRMGPLLRGVWPRLVVGARSERDAERFRSLGMSPSHVEVTGDLKFDAPASVGPVAPELASFLGEAPFWAAVSTHAGEEEAALAAHDNANASGFRGGLVLAPRHLGRVEEVKALLRARGHTFVCRSGLDAAGETRFEDVAVLLLDTLGEVPSLLPRAKLVFVGGTLVPVGGHNVLEPAWSGRSAVFGPSTANVNEAATALVEAGGAYRVPDASALCRVVATALADSAELARRGAAAHGVVSAHRGAAERSAAFIEAALRRAAPPRPDGHRVHRAALPQRQPAAPTGAVPDAGDGELGAANARHSRLRSRGSAPLPARPPSARLRRRRRRRARRLPRQLLKN